jgi:sugar phosphate isomerase/epimerase
MTSEQIISFCKQADVDCIEWGGDVHVPPYDLENAKRVGERTREAGLQVCSYGSYHVLGDGDIGPVLRTAVALGTERIRIWAGKIPSAQIDPGKRAEMVLEARRISEDAAELGIQLCFEYHRNSLTDCRQSALRLLKEIDRSNVRLYWQPNPELPEQEKLEEIRLLGKYVRAIHCFHWTGKDTRHPMATGMELWRSYLEAFGPLSVPLLLEFCIGDSPEQGKEDLAVLRKLDREYS